ncbi:6901_t:CDS:2 [Funneliformis caledonium]|uniref:6901_t:CDS:1 n=1 Tax=Funneliformis caledonium TaxID=1117310 RepID=A0A9N8ZEY8_9GLOM|nr:6901_t:CDS:2 [Funneliformis caledonium]
MNHNHELFIISSKRKKIKGKFAVNRKCMNQVWSIDLAREMSNAIYLFDARYVTDSKTFFSIFFE